MIPRLAVLSLLAVAALTMLAGSAGARGGNHGCDDDVVRSDHFWPEGDRVVAGYRIEEVGGLPPAIQEEVHVANEGEFPTTLSCGGAVGTYVKFTSDLGPGDDRLRMDAAGMEPDPSEEPYRALAKSIKAVVSGDGGDDRLAGHKGVDKFDGGSGRDLIKAVDKTRDVVDCGSGKGDKAVVDRRDRVKRCERVALR